LPIAPRRRDEIVAAVAAYDQANPFTPLPRNAARLLAVMFPEGDACRRSLEALVAEGFSQNSLPRTLRQLTEAGFLTRQRGTAAIPDTYHLHLPPLVRR
jgi:hypothetical protein